MSQILAAEIIITDHQDHKIVVFEIGRHQIARITHDKRMSPKCWCVEIGKQRKYDGWKNEEMRFFTKQHAISAVLESFGAQAVKS